MLAIGINDTLTDRGPTSADEFRYYYRDLVKYAMAQSDVIILTVEPVRNGFQIAVKSDSASRSKFNATIRSLAREYNATVVELDEYLSDADGYLRAEFTDDGVHLTGAGYKQWRLAIESAVCGP